MGRYGNPEELTPQQEAFVKHAKDFKITLTEAARLAGYSDPKGEVDRLLKNPKIFAALWQGARPKMMKLAKTKIPTMPREKSAEDDKTDYGDFLEAKKSILGTIGDEDVVNFEKVAIGIETRLAEGVPLLPRTRSDDPDRG